MTHYYFDSSALIKRYITEDGTDWVRTIVMRSAGHIIVLSRITTVEMVSALARRKREGSISSRQMRAIRHLIERHETREYSILGLTGVVAKLAEDLLNRHVLRAYDAVQLATALQANAQLSAARLSSLVFASADKRLLLAADNEGLPIEDPNAH